MTGFEHMLAEATPWLQRYGYAALALAALFEGTGIPLPGTLLMGGAALLAGQGEMNVTTVLLTAWLAAMAGDNLGYWIGRGGGRRLLLKAGVSRQRLVRFDGFFGRYGIWLILFGRFFDGTRQLDALVAGSARMPWPRFALADLAGTALWSSAWVIGLYAVERHGVVLHDLLEQINPWVAGITIALVAALIYWLFQRGGAGSDTPFRGKPGPRPSSKADTPVDGRPHS